MATLQERQQQLMAELERVRAQIAAVDQRLVELKAGEQRLVGALLLLEELLRAEQPAPAAPAAPE